jgi:AraC-like DNA-binding protein
VDDVVDEAVHARPAAALRGLVGGYSGWRQRGIPPTVHRGLPSPWLTVILTLDDPLFVLAHPDPGQRPDAFRTLIGGLHTAPALVRHGGCQSGVQIRLSPLGARAVFGWPAGEIAGLDLSGGEVLGPYADQLADRLRVAAGWPQRFALLDRAFLWLANRRRDGLRAVPSPEVRHAWRLLTAGAGTGRTDRIAAEVGWSGRHLADRFRVEIGLTPKAAARVHRFDRVRRRLQQQAARAAAELGPRPVLADFAAECGFYDQAHLAREFRSLAGCPPSVWLAEEFRIVQGDSPA